MNQLSQHIEFLLLRHDCVVVPGFGAFIGRRMDAVIDMESGCILPPHRTFAFNQAITADDGLLANSLSRKEKLDYNDARMAIALKVSNLNAALQKGEQLNFGNLGSFQLGSENNLVFTPAHKPLVGALNVGKPSAQFRTPDRTVRKERYKDTSFTNCGAAISKTFTNAAAVAAIFIALAILFIANPIPYDNRENRASVVPVEAFIKSQKTSPSEIKVKAPVPTPEINKKAEVLQASASEKQYYLIVGTFHSSEEANRYAKQASNNDFSLSVVESKRLSRVYAAHSSDFDEVRALLNKKQIRDNYPNAWIWSPSN